MDNDALAELGERIRRARKQANLTQMQLAAIIGSDQTMVSVWEKARGRRPSPAMLAKIEGACGISPGALSEGLDLPDVSAKPASFEERLTATAAEVAALRSEVAELRGLLGELRDALTQRRPGAGQGRPPRP